MASLDVPRILLYPHQWLDSKWTTSFTYRFFSRVVSNLIVIKLLFIIVFTLITWLVIAILSISIRCQWWMLCAIGVVLSVWAVFYMYLGFVIEVLLVMWVGFCLNHMTWSILCKRWRLFDGSEFWWGQLFKRFGYGI